MKTQESICKEAIERFRKDCPNLGEPTEVLVDSHRVEVYVGYKCYVVDVEEREAYKCYDVNIDERKV